jgi:hypothetical protein
MGCSSRSEKASICRRVMAATLSRLQYARYQAAVQATDSLSKIDNDMARASPKGKSTKAASYYQSSGAAARSPVRVACLIAAAQIHFADHLRFEAD